MTPSALAAKTYLALVHHPVYDKERRVVATSVTNLDIHDIARSSRTYGLRAYFLVHPVAAQQELVRRIIGHWQEGPGREQNDFRRDALSLVRVVASLAECVAGIEAEQGMRPMLLGTSAKDKKDGPPVIGRQELYAEKELFGRPLLLIFGTGYGLTEEVIGCTDRLLAPIRGTTSYNHLSVRTAAGIILDRLFAGREHDLEK